MMTSQDDRRPYTSEAPDICYQLLKLHSCCGKNRSCFVAEPVGFLSGVRAGYQVVHIQTFLNPPRSYSAAVFHMSEVMQDFCRQQKWTSCRSKLQLSLPSPESQAFFALRSRSL